LDHLEPTGDLAVLDVVATEQEAELIRGLLRTLEIACTYRQTNYGAGGSDGLPVGGPWEVIVGAQDLDEAREALREQPQPGS
jgi:Putative prokaryotic signal transducing protein